jgi:cell division septum initiation protein DivIVA
MNKSVLKKLFSEKEQSVELSEVSVELGAIDDLQNKFKVIAAKAPKLKDQIVNLANELSGVASDLSKLQSDFVKLQGMAKELGADSVENTAKILADTTKTFSSDWGKAAANISNAAKTI